MPLTKEIMQIFLFEHKNNADIFSRRALGRSLLEGKKKYTAVSSLGELDLETESDKPRNTTITTRYKCQ